jgi:dephospho-CoA kinase
MIRIGLTGGIGTGKSTVSKMLAEMGAFVIVGDQLAHQQYVKGAPFWEKVVKGYGEDILSPNGDIDRRKLAVKAFSPSGPGGPPRVLFEVQMEVSRVAARLFEEKEKEGAALVVYEQALLLEVGDNRMVDRVWLTYAPEEVVLPRVLTREGGTRLTLEQAQQRIRAQLSIEERLQRAHLLIRTDCSLEETRAQVASALEKAQDEVARGVFVSHRSLGPFEPLEPSQWLRFGSSLSRG